MPARDFPPIPYCLSALSGLLLDPYSDQASVLYRIFQKIKPVGLKETFTYPQGPTSLQSRAKSSTFLVLPIPEVPFLHR